MRADIFDTASNFLNSTEGILITLGGVVGILFLIIVAWRAKGALTAILSGAVAGILFVWAVSNIGNDDVQKQITETVIPNGHGLDLPGHSVPGQEAASRGGTLGV